MMGIMDIDLTGQTAVVFGAGKGIGETVSKQLAQAGAIVYLASRTEANCVRVMTEIVDAGNKAVAISCDVSDINQVDAVLAQAEKETGKLDIVINNAGIDCVTPFVDCSQEEMMRVIMTNQVGVNNGLQCALQIPLHRITDSASNGSVFPVVTEHFSASSDHAFL